MFTRNNKLAAVLILVLAGCKVPVITEQASHLKTPSIYENQNSDSSNAAQLSWREFFKDPQLVNLIDTALKYNQELGIALQEIEIARNEVRMRQGSLLPAVVAGGGVGVEKVGRYTSQGAGDASTQMKPGKDVPEWLPDYKVGVYASWEVDVWKKLHTAKKAALTRYLATTEGRQFVISNLVAEIASSYYELMALDARLAIVRQNIAIQKNAYEIVKLQKEAAREDELAVRKFEAEVLRSQSMEYDILQGIKETENRIALLCGQYQQGVSRSHIDFLNLLPPVVQAGIPAQLLVNRPDIRQAELSLTAAHLDLRVARAEFLPSVGIAAGTGLQAFQPRYLATLPESILFSLAGDVAGPLINKNAIRAEFNSANARQLQALYEYDRRILSAYLEVSTQLSNIDNLQKKFTLKHQQVDALNRGIEVSNDLFRAARVDYLEVLGTQRDVLEAKLELVETKEQQQLALIALYKSMGGGWR